MISVNIVVMDDIKRQLDLTNIVSSKTCFLFGPRQTGKTSLIAQQFNGAKIIDLLLSENYRKYSAHPERLREEITDNDKLVIIDEIQRLPELLNEVHYLIEKKKIKFLLTGSSAKKLRRQGINLLGGRARSRLLHPFTKLELGEDFSLIKALEIGLIPSIYFSDSPWEDLGAYIGDYLKTEIAAEGATRNIPAFSRFLEVAALCNGQMINFSQIASDSEVKLSTLRNYFEILKDTLIAYELEAWQKSKTRKAIQTSKFYFFDLGLAHFLQNRRLINVGTPEYGYAFEAYIFHELKTKIDYTGNGTIHYWRSTSGFEVDLILDEEIAVEVKAKKVIGANDLKGLKALKEEKLLKRYICICFEKVPRIVEGIEVMPFENFANEFLNELK
jgi:predicted AAA+ superfamily ATPase